MKRVVGMKKILFVNLLDLENMYVRTKQMGQLSLYNIIEEHSTWQADIWDANHLYLKRRLKLYSSNEHNYQIMTEDILRRQPTCISIYTMCNNYHHALSLAKRIKDIRPDVYVIFAGPQASTVAKETLKKFEFVDFIALGEGEKTILDILEYLESDMTGLKYEKEIKGLAYRTSNGEIVENWNRNNWCELDSLKPLQYELVDEEIYDGQTAIDMEVGRGCPFACTYCSTSIFWERNFRVKSVEKVISEVRQYIKKYNVYRFAFHHDLLTANRQYIMELSREIIRNNLNIKWACYSRLDVIDDEMITEMSKAGCYQIYYGIETGSFRMQKIINKNLDLDKIYEVMDCMISNEVKAEFSFIIGYPEENKEDLLQTIEYIKAIKEYEVERGVQFIQIHIFQIMFFPKTKMTEEYIKELVYNPIALEGNRTGEAFAVLDEELEWIKNNKEIFVNYYNLPKNITDKSRYLNIFLMTVFNYGYNFCNTALEEILKMFSGNILELYDFIYNNRYEEMVDLLVYTYFDHQSKQKEICKRVNKLFCI